MYVFKQTIIDLDNRQAKDIQDFYYRNTEYETAGPKQGTGVRGVARDYFRKRKILERHIMLKDGGNTLEINTYFESKKEYLLLSHVPTSLSGGWAVWMMAMNAFIADITKPEDRAFRYGMLHIVHSLGRPLGAPFGAYLLRTGGFLCVFCTALVGIAIGSVYLLYRINSYKWNPPKKDKVCANYQHIYS